MIAGKDSFLESMGLVDGPGITNCCIPAGLSSALSLLSQS